MQMETTDKVPMGTLEAVDRAEAFREKFERLRSEIARAFVGQDELVRYVLATLFADGHVLIEGAPGLGKTLLVRTLASALDVSFSRIQFTPDLMPTDATGTHVLDPVDGGGHHLRLEPGPLVANIVLADEINRATPKTQSALLQAMQERQVTLGKETIHLPEPYMVLATQNPIEQEGTYPLPEAQLDRFMVKLLVDYPTEADYGRIFALTTGETTVRTEAVCDGDAVLSMRRTVREVATSEAVTGFVTRVLMATQPGSPLADETVNRNVLVGASPRAGQALLLLGKVGALLDGRYAVAAEDIRAVALPVLRHRLVLRFEALTEGVSVDELIRDALDRVSEVPADG